MATTYIFGQPIIFWTGLLAGIFILLHIPSCNVHWASKLKPWSKWFEDHHKLTLDLATIFAFIHIALSVVALAGFVI